MSCCGQDIRNKMKAMVNRLEGRNPREAKELTSVIHDMDRVADKIQMTMGGGASTKIKGAPKAADKYYQSCVKANKGKPDLHNYCSRVALRVICQHVTPNWSGCEK